MIDVGNVTQDITASITNNTSSIVSKILSDFFQKIKPVVYVLVVLIILYILYRIIKFIFDRIRDRRVTKTFHNTEEILARLSKIEDRLGIRKEKKPKKKI